jgi:hypothetical protein
MVWKRWVAGGPELVGYWLVIWPGWVDPDDELSSGSTNYDCENFFPVATG